MEVEVCLRGAGAPKYRDTVRRARHRVSVTSPTVPNRSDHATSGTAGHGVPRRLSTFLHIRVPPIPLTIQALFPLSHGQVRSSLVGKSEVIVIQ